MMWSWNYQETQEKIAQKQEAAFVDFKQRIAHLLKQDNFMHQDHFLKKWLIARDWHIDAAVQMFKESYEYRMKMDADSILTSYDPPEVVKKYLTGGLLGFDKEGSPVRYENYGALDLKGLVYSCKRIDMEKTKLLECETVVKLWEEQTKKLGRTVDGLVVIMDLNEVTAKILWRPGLVAYLHVIQILEDNYPDMLKKLIVINAPAIFPIIWAVTKPLISAATRNKMVILSKSNYLDVLLKHVDKSQLPKCYGGDLTDSDGNPNCWSKLGKGGKIPESYYLKELTSTANLQNTTVLCGESLRLEFDVEVENSVLRWEFKTENFDIGFGVEYRCKNGSPKKTDTTVLVPVARVNSHIVPEEGNVVCSKPGIYIIVFDNSFSWNTDKELQYSIEVLSETNEAAKDVSLMSENEKND